MDFGVILDKWEKQGAGNQIFYKDREADSSSIPVRGRKSERRSRLLKKKPDAYLDLHGLNRDEAWSKLETFFENSYETGFEKIQIIHGKGNHSQKEAALRELCRTFIENCPFAGESGFCPAREGGNGATWVILKQEH